MGSRWWTGLRHSEVRRQRQRLGEHKRRLVTPVQGTPAAHSHGEGHGVTTTASGQEGRRWAPADEHGGGLLGSALRVAHRRTGRWQHKGGEELRNGGIPLGLGKNGVAP